MPGRGHSTRSGNWIRAAASLALLAMIFLLLVMSRHPVGLDERSYLLWVW